METNEQGMIPRTGRSQRRKKYLGQRGYYLFLCKFDETFVSSSLKIMMVIIIGGLLSRNIN